MRKGLFKEQVRGEKTGGKEGGESQQVS